VIDKNQAGRLPALPPPVFALASYPVAVERGFYAARCGGETNPRDAAAFSGTARKAPRPMPPATTLLLSLSPTCRPGVRAWKCRALTVDSAFSARRGALAAGVYFAADAPDEHEIRTLATRSIGGADWKWAQNRGATLTLGWKPQKRIFSSIVGKATTRRCCCIPLALGSPTFRCPRVAMRRGFHIPVGALLRTRLSLRPGRFSRTSSPHLDRFSRHSGRFHARQRHRLFREQPPRNLLRNSNTQLKTRSNLRAMVGCWGFTAGRWPRPRHHQSERHQTQIFRLRATRRALPVP